MNFTYGSSAIIIGIKKSGFLVKNSGGGGRKHGFQNTVISEIWRICLAAGHTADGMYRSGPNGSKGSITSGGY